MMQYPKRLIEVDLPIRRISAHARREKDMRRGHIPLLHIYPAARPPAACRAVMCAALWPDPADPLCPSAFRDAADRELRAFAMAATTDRTLSEVCDHESWKQLLELTKSTKPISREQLRHLLLNFIADYASWGGATNAVFLETSRRITAAAHLVLAADGTSRPVVVDSFAGGGAIPLEAARLGADSFASDTNPIAVLLNTVILESVPAYREELRAEVQSQIDWMKSQAEQTLGHLYPADADGAIPTTYLWARTVKCEGPGCGVTVPLLRTFRLVRKESRALYLKIVLNRGKKQLAFELTKDGARQNGPDGTVRRGAVTCPLCGFTTPVESVRRQLVMKRGGVRDAQLLVVVTTRSGKQGRSYRLPTAKDFNVVQMADQEFARLTGTSHANELSPVPNEEISLNEIRRVSVPLYGLTSWGDLFAPRQAIALSTFCNLVIEAGQRVMKKKGAAFGKAVQLCLALLLDKLADMNTSLCVWQNHAEIPAHLFGRWAIGMVFDFAETNPLAGSSGSLEASGKRFLDGLDLILAAHPRGGHVELADATRHPLPDNFAHLFMVDPPYYDAIPYAHLMDFFYCWLRRSLSGVMPDLFKSELISKDSEIVVDRPHQLSTSTKNVAFYERELTKAFIEGRRILQANGIAVVVFASKTTVSWEAVLQAIVEAGWVITGSWPIDTEMESRVAAQGQARLASSVHLVCRPREKVGASIRGDETGDWRDVLQELPRRIHEWMPRLAEEGIVGADAIFACLGPALEIFSRYSQVEKASGEIVALKEYLEHVWAAVAKEALTQVFKDADTTGFEPDARITAMWLWTLSGGTSIDSADDSEEAKGVEEKDQSGTSRKTNSSGYTLEFDAARKIGQGLGARLEDLSTVIEVKGDAARLLPVAERAKTLFGKDSDQTPAVTQKKKDKQLKLELFDELTDAKQGEVAWKEKAEARLGATTLDRVHQSMILFAAGRGEAMKRFLVDDGAGQDQRFWQLAQALSALYPSSSDEKRWVDGVLARKKGLGL